VACGFAQEVNHEVQSVARLSCVERDANWRMYIIGHHTNSVVTYCTTSAAPD
jgi:hypothetical protein